MSSANEYSMRYSTVSDDPEVTGPDEWRQQATDNKQGSGSNITNWPKDWFKESMEWNIDGPKAAEIKTWLKEMENYPYVQEAPDMNPGDVLSALSQHATQTSMQTYEKLLAAGVAREQARSVLPMNTYTEFYWKQDLHNLLNMLRLRLDAHAQLEIREFATAIAMIVQDWVPMTYEAFTEHRLESMQLSGSVVSQLSKACTENPEFKNQLLSVLEQGTSSQTELRTIKSKIWK